MLRESDSANRIEQTFQQQVNGRAWHIHPINGEYAFDVEKHPGARIETRTDDITNDEAIHRVERLVREEFFADRNNVYIWRGVDNHIDISDSTTLKLLVRLDEADYEAGFKEMISGEGPESDEAYQFQNSFAVVGPKQELTTNEGILQIARRVVAGEQLQSKNEDLSSEFYGIHSDNKNTLEERVLEKYGQVYTTAEHGGSIKLAPTTIGDENGDLYNPAIDAIRPDDRQVKRELLSKLEEEGEGGIQYEYLVKDFQRDATYPTLPGEGILEDAVKDLCADGEIQVGSTTGERPSSPADTATIVHTKYVNADDGGGKKASDDTGGGITVDPRGGSSGGSNGGTTTGTSGGAGTTTGTGTTTSSGGDGGGGEEAVEIVTFPAMEPIRAENKFELEDRVERKLGEEWEIHELKLTFTGPVKEDELSHVGLDGHGSLADATNVEQTLTITPDEPVDKDEVVEIIRDLTPPERASFEVRLQVAKYE